MKSEKLSQAFHTTLPPQQKPVIATLRMSAQGWSARNFNVAPTSLITCWSLAAPTIFMIAGKSVSGAGSPARSKKPGAIAT